MRKHYFAFSNKKDLILIIILLNAAVFSHYIKRNCVFFNKKIIKNHFYFDFNNNNVVEWRNESLDEKKSILSDEELILIKIRIFMILFLEYFLILQ